MLRFRFENLVPPIRLLCLGAHCDDLEIGLVLTLAAGPKPPEFTWLIFSFDATTPRRCQRFL